MLKILRHKKTAKKIWLGLALIIVPAFTLWGFGGAFRSREENMEAGRIFGRTISGLELKDSLSAVTTTATIQYGDKLPEIQKYLNLEAQAWQRLVLLEEAKRRSIRVSDQEVIKLIQEFPYFQYKGAFDKRTYEQALQYVFRLKPRDFEEQMRQSLMLNKLYTQITAGLTVDENETRKEYDKYNQEISIYYIASLAADFSKKITPTDSQLKDYLKNKEAFINEQALKKAEDKINQCSNELKTQDFKKAAKKCGLEVKETAPFKFGANITGLGASDKFWITALTLKEGANSEIIRLPSGFYIIKVKSVIKGNDKKYAQDKASIREGLFEQKKEEKFRAFLIELDKKAQQFRLIGKQ